MKKLVVIIIAAAIFAAPAFLQAGPTTQADVEGYLTAMKLKYEKKGGALTFTTGFPDGKQYKMICKVDEKNKFVYMAVTALASLKETSPKVCDVTKKIAELNYGMMMTKLEWDKKAGEVLLSATMSTEDGLSAKRFTNTLTTLLLVAEQAEKAFK